jgi:putative phosphoesterase
MSIARSMTAVVLADTHLHAGPDGSLRRWLPEAAEPYLASADLILHAGDLLDEEVLVRLRGYGPVRAVLGNNDRSLVGLLPESVAFNLAGVNVAMIHDSGPSSGRARRMKRRFPDADVVVFGHSQAPCNETGEGGQVLFNPGSPTQRRAQPSHSLGLLVATNGVLTQRQIVLLD